MAEEIKFIGNFKEIEAKFGSILKMGLKKEDLDYLMSNLNDRGFVNVDICTSQNGNKYAKLNTYVASGSSDGGGSKQTYAKKQDANSALEEENKSMDDLPF